MKRVSAFSVRIAKELLRDPLSYIFCLAFPLVMLVVMSLINESIPPQAGVTTFRIDNLAGGIAVFGLTFVMLFTCLSISKDRSSAFLTRLYATPMPPGGFIAGYLLPVLVLAVIQTIITFAAGFVVSLITGIELNVLGLLLAVVMSIPTGVLMTGFGLLFGSLFNEKAAPGLCSIVISLSCFLGGIFFDPDSTGGILLTICKALPFYHAVKCARLACALDFDGFWGH
ncbi:MAG: ABC transporter permease, partial [Oscillospiraceae bacterium]